MADLARNNQEFGDPEQRIGRAIAQGLRDAPPPFQPGSATLLSTPIGHTRQMPVQELFSWKGKYSFEEAFLDTQAGTIGTFVLPNLNGIAVQINDTTNGTFWQRDSKYRQVASASSGMVVVQEVLFALQENVQFEWGLMDDNNGAFFRASQSGATDIVLEVGYRTDTFGVVTETMVQQADWNLDKLDGSGPSGINLDALPETVHYYTAIDFGHLNTGITFNLAIGGEWIPLHRIDFAMSALFGASPTREWDLPLRWRFENVADDIIAAGSLIVLYNATVLSDISQVERRRVQRTIITVELGVANNQTYTLASIRPKAAVEGRANTSAIVLDSVEVQSDAGGRAYIYVSDTLTGPATFADVDTANSIAEFSDNNQNATDPDGIPVFSKPVSNINGASVPVTLKPSKDIVLRAFSDGSGADILSVFFEAEGGGDIMVAINWTELI